MVTLHKSTHRYDYDFSMATQAFYKKYPNPFSSHVVSCDTISCEISPDHKLHISRLVHKQGSLPAFLQSWLGNISDSWIMETSVVDPANRVLQSWTRNLNHRKILRVDDLCTYRADGTGTVVENKVRFQSGLNFGIKSRVEKWSRDQFASKMAASRQGLAHVMERMAAASMS